VLGNGKKPETEGKKDNNNRGKNGKKGENDVVKRLR
jgi:hypothetical protein